MTLTFEITTNSSENIFLWDISESIEELIRLYCADGSPLPAIHDAERMRHFLASRLLVRRIFPNQPLKKDAFGKPFIPGFAGGISLSHTANLAGLLVSPSGHCGLDIEIPQERITRFAHRFCAKEELDFLEAATMKEALHIIWGAKECIYKAYGRKGIDFRAQMLISPFVVSREGLINGTLFLADVVHQYRICYKFSKGYVLLWTVHDSG